MVRYIPGAVALALILLTSNSDVDASPLSFNRHAVLHSVRRTGRTGTSSSSVSSSNLFAAPNTNIDEWYEDGCDELLEASNNHVYGNDNDNEVQLCSVSNYTWKVGLIPSTNFSVCSSYITFYLTLYVFLRLFVIILP